MTALPRHYRLKEVAALTAQSRTSIWRGVRNDKFPKPTYLLDAKTPTWAEGDLVRHIETRRAAAGLPPLEEAPKPSLEEMPKPPLGAQKPPPPEGRQVIRSASLRPRTSP